MEYTNEAGWDRALRVVLGLVMIYLGWFVLGDGLPAAVFKIFGFVPLITGLIGWCPFYTLFGLATKKSGAWYSTEDIRMLQTLMNGLRARPEGD